jgi:Eco57I restriction-modification methylase
MAPITQHHAEWLSLMDVSGPFLSISVLKDVFPNGLDSHDSMIAAELRAAHDAWSDPAGAGYDDPEAVHRAFVDFVFERVLGFRKSDLVRDADRLKSDFATSLPMHPVKLIPDAVVLDGEAARLLVAVSTPAVPVDQPVPGSDWSATPRERMVEMLRGTGCPLGLVTDGERWTLVTRREGEAPGYATWWASLWREERLTLQAFRTLLGAQRFFSVPDDETLPGLLDRSAEDQSEVTTKLGNQTLEAVEILVRTLDQLDRDRGGELLRDMPEPELYDAAVTVMMRLVVLFFAEENDLLPMSEDLWESQYAASSLRSRLQRAADEGGEEVLEAHSDAWPRLLATWRAVYGGVEHGNMRLAPYGGSLFDPDRYPFLEGRLPGTAWEDADPLPVGNRTVLHLLNSLQTLHEGGQRRKLSFRALDVEQIGHVYEGMLDHTAARAESWVLGLSGTGEKEPETPLEALEALDDEGLVTFLAERTGRNAATIRQWFEADSAEEVKNRFGTHWAPAFAGDAQAANRVQRFAKFVRTDSFGAPTVFQPGSVYVCDSSHRGATGTHYTPRSFTEEMVTETLDPLVYEGIAEGKPETEWKLRTPSELLALNVGDPACGSGAFLVQACRYLSAKLVESRRVHGELDHDPTEEDLIHARREVASRCLYGVDVNPMAVEMAKLSLWLVTLERDKPFSFLDHAIGVGDSLVGLTSLDQLRHWSLAGEGDPQEMITGLVAGEVEEALEFRRNLEAAPAIDIQDVEHKRRLLDEARKATERLTALADLLFAPSLASENASEVDRLRDSALHFATNNLGDPEALRRKASPWLGGVRPFQWLLEFPEVFERGGFDAIVGNPPFMGGQKITGTLGRPYREHLVEVVAWGTRGSADLVAYFFLRAFALIREPGNVGLLAVNTISEGDTRQVGLESLVSRGATITAAHPDEPWPNVANVRTSRVHFRSGFWNGPVRLNSLTVDVISPYLSGRTEASPERLQANREIAFNGMVPYGIEFLMTPQEAQDLIKSDRRNAEVIFPYLVGRDINQDVFQSATREAICFWDWDKKQARRYPLALARVEKLVKPFRHRRDDDGEFILRAPLRDKWWQYEKPRPALYHALGRGHHFESHPKGYEPSLVPLEKVIVCAQVTKHLSYVRCPNTVLFDQKTVVFVSDSVAFLAYLSSTINEAWARQQSGTMRVDLSYSPTDAFLTLPLPTALATDASLATLGEKLELGRLVITDGRGCGLTDLYNSLHDPGDQSDDMVRLRRVHSEIDRRVAELYDWLDIELGHGFHQVTYLASPEVRYTISEEARLKILDRLGSLNRERYDEEVAAGHHEKKGGKKKPKTAKKKAPKKSVKEDADTQTGLFTKDDAP